MILNLYVIKKNVNMMYMMRYTIHISNIHAGTLLGLLLRIAHMHTTCSLKYYSIKHKLSIMSSTIIPANISIHQNSFCNISFWLVCLFQAWNQDICKLAVFSWSTLQKKYMFRSNRKTLFKTNVLNCCLDSIFIQDIKVDSFSFFRPDI